MVLLETGSGQFGAAKMVAHQEQNLLMKALRIYSKTFSSFETFVTLVFLWFLFCFSDCLISCPVFWKSVLNEIIIVASVFCQKKTTNSSFNSTQLFNVGQSDSCMVPCCPHTWTRVKYPLCFQVETVRGGIWSETSFSRVSHQQEVKKVLFSACYVLACNWCGLSRIL